MRIPRLCAVLILTILIAALCAVTGLAERRELTSQFNGSASSAAPEMVFTVTMDDDWFNASSAGYSHDLARLSLGMAGAAFRSSAAESMSEKDKNIRAFFAEAGFGNYEQKQFDIKPTIDTIGTAMASKVITDGDGSYTLIAIGVSGAGYADEWLSNFSIDNGEEHAGFSHAAQIVIDRFNDYRARFAPEGRVKVWISGFSRASAVSNLTAYDLITLDNGIDPNDVFAYCFAVPLCTRSAEAYPQINNICGAFDPVPMIPFPEWGYDRHGVTRYITAAELDTSYAESSAAAAAIYEQASGLTNFGSSQEANWLIRKVLQMLYSIIPDAASYTAEFQNAIKDAWSCQGNAAERLNLLIDEIDAALQANGIEAEADLSDLMTLIKQCMFGSMMETYGSKESRLSELLTSGVDIAREHFPGVYMAWLLSADEDTLYDHPDYGYRLAVTNVEDYGETPVAIVENLTTGESFELTTDLIGTASAAYNVISIGSEYMLSLPGGSDYRVTVTITPTETQMALTSFSCNNISSVTTATQTIKAVRSDPTNNDGVQIVVYVSADGTARAEYNGEVYPFESDVLDGSVMQEMKLNGNYSELLFNSMVDSVYYETIPHIIMIVILVLFFLGLGIVYLIRALLHKRTPNERVRNEKIVIRILFYLAAAACLVQLQLHARYINATFSVFRGNANMIQRMMGNLMKYGSLGFEFSTVICYSILTWLCIRAPIRKRSLNRCHDMALLMFLPESMVLLNELWYEYSNPYVLASVITITAIILLTGITMIMRRRAAKKLKAMNSAAM